MPIVPQFNQGQHVPVSGPARATLLPVGTPRVDASPAIGAFGQLAKSAQQFGQANQLPLTPSEYGQYEILQRGNAKAAGYAAAGEVATTVGKELEAYQQKKQQLTDIKDVSEAEDRIYAAQREQQLWQEENPGQPETWEPAREQRFKKLTQHYTDNKKLSPIASTSIQTKLASANRRSQVDTEVATVRATRNQTLVHGTSIFNRAIDNNDIESATRITNDLAQGGVIHPEEGERMLAEGSAQIRKQSIEVLDSQVNALIDEDDIKSATALIDASSYLTPDEKSKQKEFYFARHALKQTEAIVTEDTFRDPIGTRQKLLEDPSYAIIFSPAQRRQSLIAAEQTINDRRGEQLHRFNQDLQVGDIDKIDDLKDQPGYEYLTEHDWRIARKLHGEGLLNEAAEELRVINQILAIDVRQDPEGTIQRNVANSIDHLFEGESQLRLQNTLAEHVASQTGSESIDTSSQSLLPGELRDSALIQFQQLEHWVEDGLFGDFVAPLSSYKNVQYNPARNGFTHDREDGETVMLNLNQHDRAKLMKFVTDPNKEDRRFGNIYGVSALTITDTKARDRSFGRGLNVQRTILGKIRSGEIKTIEELDKAINDITHGNFSQHLEKKLYSGSKTR